MNIFFSGIGGVGMGPLAEIARDAGYDISGSDVEESLMTQKLLGENIDVHFGPQDGRFLQHSHDQQPIDWFVYTPALRDDHPELVLARQLGIPTVKRGEYLAHFVAEKNLKLIAVSGTHGKTTTTGMIIWAAQQLGIPVGYSIGTTIGFGPSGLYDPAAEYFVYECDEFDRNFLYFHPHISVIASIDYDHPDTYPTEHDYRAAFRQFIDQSESVVMWQSDAARIDTHDSRVWSLGNDEVLDIRIPGVHNRRNATLVVKMMERLGAAGAAQTIAVLETFPGTDRRFEKLADNLYSDYGHHPVEIAATLQLAHEIADRIVLVYQPHQNIRQHEMRNEYTDQFELADEVYWLPTYLSREDPNLAVLTPEELSAKTTNRDHIHVADFNDTLWNTIEKARDDGFLVLGMGAGEIDNWLRQQLSH